MKKEATKLQKISLAFVAFLILGVAFGAGAWFGYTDRPSAEKVFGVLNQQPQNLKEIDFGLFWEAWSQLEEKYVDRANIDRQKMIYGAISGLTHSLKDPYTEFFPPAESKQFQEDVKGSFGGIGAEIGIRKDILTIIAPLKGNPAEKVGLKAGDKILKIDDTLTGDLGLNEAVRLIRGEPGTTVRLSIIREGMTQPKEYKIVRDVIKVMILTTDSRPDGIFIIKLNQFTESSGTEFRKAVQEFSRVGSKKLILDLRNNPGGYLTMAVEIGSWFAPAGEVIARERYADGKEDIYRSHGYRIFGDVPTVILVNEGSASASEIVAGALRDLKGIKLVGAKTFGKGSVQEVVDLPKGSSLKITIAKWLTPKGTEIDGKGLEPDVKVELPKESTEEEASKDLIFEKGIEVLKNL